jgi:hypothetical protein
LVPAEKNVEIKYFGFFLQVGYLNMDTMKLFDQGVCLAFMKIRILPGHSIPSRQLGYLNISRFQPIYEEIAKSI